MFVLWKHWSCRALSLWKRECCPGPCCAESSPQNDPANHNPSRDRGCSGGVKLRIRNRRSEPASRPHSWHSTKLGDGQQDPSMMQISQGSMGAPWHQNCHSSVSTTDLSTYEVNYLRKSPDQYSSRGSMESLDPAHLTYSSCHQLSASKSSNSIDHLHSKRDSAYSSFSTSSSIPEYLAAVPTFPKERSYSMEHVPQQKGAESMQQADIRYVRTVYDPQQGVSEEHEVMSGSLLRNSEGRMVSRSGESSSGSAYHHGNSSSGSSCSSGSSGGTSASHQHSVGPVWSHTPHRNSYECLKGAPAPPLRSDSFAAIRNHERPNSWSSLEQPRSLRSLHKGSWHHSSGPVASGKSSFGLEGQLHTVIEKSPESSPTTKPKQGFPQSSQPGRLMLPTGIYPVPQPEPHFAQIPTSCPISSSVYPALTKENTYPSQRDQFVERGLGSGDGVSVENGYQSNVLCHASSPPQGSTQYKSPGSQHAEKEVEEPQTKCSIYRTHLQGRPLVQTIRQERRDPYTPTQPRGDRHRYSQHNTELPDNSQHSRQEEPVRLTEPNLQQSHDQVPQGQFVHANRINSAPSQTLVQGMRQHSDSSPPHDAEHPLTRLENALAEVQRCASPESTISQGSFQSERSMSVLEKVSHFERRESTKVRSHSLGHGASYRPNHDPASAKSSFSGIEDLCSMLDRSTNSRVRAPSSCSSSQGQNMACQESTIELQQRRGSSDQTYIQRSILHDPALALHRSKSSYHLSEENRNDFLWRDELHESAGLHQDTSFNRAYRDSIKDAQPKVLRSTSFRRKDLSVSPPPVSVKHMSLERKGPKTSPKPTNMSPHTPKERHVVTPDMNERILPPELPSVPPVGPPVVRIGARKRLTVEQKKRSYSEPENMHEVGVSDPETTTLGQRKHPQQLLMPETSVADRRRMFEMVAIRNACPKPSSSRPELKQMQQDALADYMERKTGLRIDGRMHRPHSAYLQLASSSSTDSHSLSSTSSVTSLQETVPDNSSMMNRQSSTLPSNLHSYFYYNRNSERPHMEYHHSLYRQPSKTREPQRPTRAPSLSQTGNLEPYHGQALIQQKEGPLERAASARSSGKSASAEDLLDRREDKAVPQHFRARSSPAVETFHEDFLAREVCPLEVGSRDSLPSRLPTNRSVDNVKPERPASASAVRVEHYQLNQGPSQLNTPVTRREKSRHGDRPRSHSASGLAASVGLPCPFQPGTVTSQDWQSSDRLCQANLDAITFPTTPQTGTQQLEVSKGRAGTVRQSSTDTSTSEDTLKDFPIEGVCQQKAPKTPVAPPQDRSSSETVSPSPPELPPKLYRKSQKKAPPSPLHLSHNLPSLRISESNLQITPLPSISQDDDEVFLRELAPPPAPLSPTLPIRETDITEDFPLPPSPVTVLLPGEGANYQGTEAQPPSRTLQANSLDYTAVHRGTVSPEARSTPLFPSPDAHLQYQRLGSISTDKEPKELDLDNHLLSKRERSAAEQKVAALARDLVSRDKSLTLLLDSWVGKNAMDLMEEIFPAGGLSSRRQRRSSLQQEDRKADGLYSFQEAHPADVRHMETDVDEVDTDLRQKLGELLQALAGCMDGLRGEREQLGEEHKRLSVVGEAMEALVQERCKPNERDKYRMFIGDLDKIINLHLSLSGRLARVENALSTLESEPETEDSVEEKKSLQQKRKQLCSQQEDARELKENLDRRERVVLDILGGYLSSMQLRDYQHYVRVRPALLIRQRHLDDLIRQGEEQLLRLGETLSDETTPQLSPSLWNPLGSKSVPRPTTVTSL
ncbi:protein Shroom3 isoform X2 [Denticeps clupeoides]|uniref:protein Shroom3 isoform X2 n=1 Tax=Denticeps clupeoides TaxID=299321 RepID=UPI0010A41FF0|nr:protein Shroom3 isoform X2 [Denticeps clupeoides]